MFKLLRGIWFGLALLLSAGQVWAQECPPIERGLPPRVPPPERAFNPNPSDWDFELPLPCGGKLLLRYVCVPAKGYFGDQRLDMGCLDCNRRDQNYMEGKRRGEVGGVFALEDLPPAWRAKLTALAAQGDGRCPPPREGQPDALYYFIGKYEITNHQWDAVMNGECQGGPLNADSPRPKTDISWFEAVEFTRRYTEWLLQKAPEALPGFEGGRTAFVRLPTEAEWEYAARGGQRVTELQMNQADFFPLGPRRLQDFAVYTELGAAKNPEKLAWIGTKCSNPLGLYDTAGNAAEMVLEPFHFTVGFRLHGAAGGFVAKGGSYRKGRAEIMPGRREEMPFFLDNGSYRSTDLGLRVVLSGILTPKERTEALQGEWAAAGQRTAPQDRPGSGAGGEDGPAGGKDPLKEVDRLLGLTKTEKEKGNLLALKEVIRNNSIVLEEQTKETIKGFIRSALFTGESVRNYQFRLGVTKSWLDRVKDINVEELIPSDRQYFEEKVAQEQQAARALETTIDYYLQFYLSTIRELLTYSGELVEDQMKGIFAELSLQEPLGEELRERLFLFQKHMEMYQGSGDTTTKDIILRDLTFERDK